MGRSSHSERRVRVPRGGRAGGGRTLGPRLAVAAVPSLDRGHLAGADRRGRGPSRRRGRAGDGRAATRAGARLEAAAVGGARRPARLRDPPPGRAPPRRRQAAGPALGPERGLPGAHAPLPGAPPPPRGRAHAPARPGHLGPRAVRADGRRAPRGGAGVAPGTRREGVPRARERTARPGDVHDRHPDRSGGAPAARAGARGLARRASRRSRTCASWPSEARTRWSR